jgi:hypothetical protein
MDGPHGETLQQSAPRDILGQLLNRDAGLDAPDVRLAESLTGNDIAMNALSFANPRSAHFGG